MLRQIAVFAILLLVACRPGQSQLVNICEDKIRETLRSPSSYKRISASLASGISLLWYAYEDEKKLFGLQTSETEKALLARSGTGGRVFYTTIEYDAVNAFNAPIRGKVRCAYFSLSPDLSSIKDAYRPEADVGMRQLRTSADD